MYNFTEEITIQLTFRKMMFGTSTGKKKEINRKQDEKTGELIQRLEGPGTLQTSSVQHT